MSCALHTRCSKLEAHSYLKNHKKTYLCHMPKSVQSSIFLRIVLCFYAAFLLAGCQSIAQVISPALPYRLDKPQQRVELEDELHEISGLEMAPNGQDLLAVQDERGSVYVLDGKNMRIKQRIDFIPEGDFEGVTAIGDTLYAVKSNGHIFRIIAGGTPQQQTDRYKNNLSKEYDVEGLVADPVRRILLLACKAAPPDKPQDEKHIYAIHLDGMALDTTPYMRIRLDDIVQFLEQNKQHSLYAKMLEYLTRAEHNGALRFSPSGLAVHPISGHYYILSAPGRMMAVYSPQGKPLAMYRFAKEIFEQPEGICFDNRGTLYIASEGKEGKGIICVFPMVK
jgi:uncharacterized protein YjiK